MCVNLVCLEVGTVIELKVGRFLGKNTYQGEGWEGCQAMRQF